MIANLGNVLNDNRWCRFLLDNAHEALLSLTYRLAAPDR